MANLARVTASLHRLVDPGPEGLGMSQRNIVVSTVGLVPAIRKLTEEGLQVTLALSLHAPDDELRDTLVPVNTRWPIKEVLEAAFGYDGSAGICSTHHPFTAPVAKQDLRNLYTDPLSIIGDHYDLVINGVEVGGGSVRIHDAAIQELIFRDVLKMSPERIEDFRHLLEALSAGCPPHAGFALGFDRLMAVLLEKESVKDVIAFPKTAAGEDKMVSSPAKMTEDQLKTYHLAVRDSGQAPKSEPVSLEA